MASAAMPGSSVSGLQRDWPARLGGQRSRRSLDPMVRCSICPRPIRPIYTIDPKSPQHERRRHPDTDSFSLQHQSASGSHHNERFDCISNITHPGNTHAGSMPLPSAYFFEVVGAGAANKTVHYYCTIAAI